MRRWLGVLVLCLLAAAPASAAFKRAPIELGPSDGESPSAVVDPRERRTSSGASRKT